MSSTPTVKKLTASERLEKMASPKVDILVGSEMKLYSIPKDLICYYSEYFDRCFHESFKEATEQKLTLSEDRLEDFEMLLDYILTGHVSSAIKVKANNQAGLDKCINFIEYADKYFIREAGMAIYDSLVKIIESSKAVLKSNHITTVFRVFPKGHAMRSLVAKASLNAEFKWQAKYREVEHNVDGFALEMLMQLRSYVGPRIYHRKRNVIPMKGEVDEPNVDLY